METPQNIPVMIPSNKVFNSILEVFKEATFPAFWEAKDVNKKMKN